MSYHEIKRKDVKANKEHECSWCGQTIRVREFHQRRNYIINGEFLSSREHFECAEAMDEFDWVNNDPEYMPGEFGRGTI